MGIRQWWITRRNRPKRIDAKPEPGAVKADLREFLYLDEVSLRSLLSSVTGDLRDSASEQTSDAIQAEVASALKVGNALAGAEGKLSSRFQTTNNSMVQTSRKSTVQSWFKQFHELEGLRLIEVSDVDRGAENLDALLSTSDKSLLIREGELARGELVEFRVRLSADPVYQLGATATELSGMAEDYPEMFEAGGTLASLREVQPVGKVLDRLLVGLIPIRAVAIDYSVLTIEGNKYVAHNDILGGLDVETEPLEIVGVTEQSAYWKDLRRVLFSQAEVTVLGRISRAGIQESWTPVKLAHLFQGLAPELVASLNEAGRTGIGLISPGADNPGDSRLTAALELYANAILDHKNSELTDLERKDLAATIASLGNRSRSVSSQSSAFAMVRSRIVEISGTTVGARRELAFREHARVSSGLPLFPSLSTNNSIPETQATGTKPVENLLDIEVVAIYW